MTAAASWLAGRARVRCADRIEVSLSDVALQEARRHLIEDGFALAGNVRPHAPFADAIRAARASGLPASAILVDAAAWEVFAHVTTAVAPIGGREYGLVADAWAFHVPPGTSGWAPHRGTTHRLDRARPELLNVWIALVDVPVEASSMAFVPLGRDPGYATSFDVSPPSSNAGVALPARAGDVLVWNANTLHWGGENRAEHPRISLSFSMADRAFATAEGLPLVDGPCSDDERLDRLATQILTYGRDQPDVTDEVNQWAAALTALSDFRRLRL